MKTRVKAIRPRRSSKKNLEDDERCWPGGLRAVVTRLKHTIQGLFTSTPKAFNIVSVQYNIGCRTMMGLPRICSASGTFARTEEYYIIMRKKTATLLCRQRASVNSILRTVAGRYDTSIMRHIIQMLVMKIC